MYPRLVFVLLALIAAPLVRAYDFSGVVDGEPLKGTATVSGPSWDASSNKWKYNIVVKLTQKNSDGKSWASFGGITAQYNTGTATGTLSFNPGVALNFAWSLGHSVGSFNRVEGNINDGFVPVSPPTIQRAIVSFKNTFTVPTLYEMVQDGKVIGSRILQPGESWAASAEVYSSSLISIMSSPLGYMRNADGSFSLISGDGQQYRVEYGSVLPSNSYTRTNLNPYNTPTNISNIGTVSPGPSDIPWQSTPPATGGVDNATYKEGVSYTVGTLADLNATLNKIATNTQNQSSGTGSPADMTGTNTRLDALNTSNAALKSSLEAKLDALNATTAANKTTVDFTATNAKLDALNTATAANKSELTATNTKLDGIKDSYELGNDGVKLLLGELNTNTVANKTDLTATNAKLDALNTAIVENKTTVDFTATNAKLDALNATTAANKTDLTATNAKLDGIKDSYEVGNDGVKLLLGELTLVTSNNKIDLTATNSKLDQINTSIVENKTTVDFTATNAKLDAINDTLAVLADEKNGEKLDRIGNLIETENTRKITQEEDLTEAVADQVTQGQNHNAEAGTIGQSAAALMAKAPTVPSAANFAAPSNDFYKVTHGNRTFNLNPLADPRLSPIAAFARSLAVWAVCFVFLGVLVKNCSWLLESVSSAQTTTAGPTTIAGFGSSYPAGVIKAAACVTLIMALIPLSYAAFTGLLAGFDPTSIISVNPFSSALEAAGNSVFAAEGIKLLNQFLPLDLCVIATVTALIHKFTVQSLSIALSTAFRWITG